MTDELYHDKFAWLYDFFQAGVKNDINFYLNYFKNYKGEILEIGAGTGRITIPLLKNKINVTALDIAPKMLDILKNKLQKRRLSANIICADMRNFKIKQKFNAIIVTYRTFQHMYSIKDQKDALNNIKKHLKNKGILIFDVYNPKISFIEKGDWRWRMDKKSVLVAGNKIKIFQRNKYDMAEQIMYQEYKIKHPRGKTDIIKLKMRFFFLFELCHLLEMSGFKLKNIYGDFKKNKFTTNSPEMIFIAEAK